MKINLKDIKIHYISTCEGKYAARCDHMRQLANDLDLNFIHEKSGYKYPKSVNDGHTSILKKNDGLVLVLEDDVNWSGESTEIEVPDDADAVYLGNMCYGNGFPRSCVFEKRDAVFSKVVTMNGAHAVLYITEKYKKDAIKSIDQSNQALDLTLAEIQHKYNVYTYNRPLFYQNNYNQPFTKISVSEIEHLNHITNVRIIIGLLLGCIILLFNIYKFSFKV